MKTRWSRALVVLAFAAIPATLCQFWRPAPVDRFIHMEAFRYGKRPSVIRANRGDRLHLTFSSLDTGHSFFLEEFDVDAKFSPGSKLIERYRTSDPTQPVELEKEIVIHARHPGLKNYLVAKSVFRDHVWTGPLHGFEHGNLIIEPNTLLFASLGALIGLPIAGLMGVAGSVRRNEPVLASVDPEGGVDLLGWVPGLKWLVKRRSFQSALHFVTLPLFYIVLLTMLFGTKVAGRNLGSMLLWVVWLFALTALMTPLGGRVWCFACPLPVLGEWIQRGAITQVRVGHAGSYRNRFFGWFRRWPWWLANAWPRMLLLLAMGTFSIALVAVPKVSGLVLLGMVLTATVMSLIWRHRAFCMYICPINAFVGLYAMAGKLALRSRNPDTCARCVPRSCQTGNDRGWACPYDLCVADIRENNDCGLCTECLKSCVYDNVALRWRPFGGELGIRNAGEAWLAMSMFVLGIVYCVVHLGHWPEMRDWVNILDKGNWDLFGIYAAVVWVLAVVVFPVLMAAVAWMGKVAAGAAQSTWELLLASTAALVPAGLGVWIAFVVPMLFVNVSFVGQAASDPFGWGWNLFGRAGTPWHQLWPESIPWIQAICVLGGTAYSLRNAWRIWLGALQLPRLALRGMMPFGCLLLAVSGWLLWFFVN